MTDGFTDALYRGLPDDTIWTHIRERLDEAALRAFLHRHSGRLTASARARTADDATANDAVQEAVIRLVRDRAKLLSHGAAMAWLYRVVNRKAWQFQRSERRRKAREAVASSARPEGVSPPDLPTADVAAQVSRAVAELPERERRAVELVYFEGMTHDAAAEALGWSRGTVGTYVVRARQRLEDLLTQRGITSAGGLVGALLMTRELTGSPLRVAQIVSIALRTPAAWRLSPAWVLAAGVIGMATVLGGTVVWNADTEVPPVAPSPTRGFEPPSAGLATNNLRAFETHARDRLQDSLDDMVAGEGGQAEITSVQAYVTQLIVTATVTHGKRTRPPLKLWLAVETVDLNTYLLADVDASGTYWPVQFHTDPVTWKLGFPNDRLRLGAFDKVRRALQQLPRTRSAQPSVLAERAAILPTVQAVSGEWERAGQRYRLVAVSDRDFHALELYRIAPFKEALCVAWNVIWRLPDGTVKANLLYDCGIVTISADGTRITGPTGEPWRRIGSPK